MACNNTSYIAYLTNSTEAQDELFKHKFLVDNFNHNVPVAMTLNKCITPVWIVIGIFGNIISAMVWSNPRMRTCNTAAYYLTSLAVADLTFLVLHFIYELENPWLLRTLDFDIWCQIFSTANIAVQYFCVFLVFAFTVERFLSVCHPFKSERFGKTRTPRTIFCLLMVSIILSLPQNYFWQINHVGECQVRVTEINKDSFFSIYTWCTELSVFGVLPLIVLLLNIAVLLKIRTIGKLKLGKASNGRHVTDNSMSALVADADSHSGKRMNSCTNGGAHASNKGTTVTLLWVSFYLIITVLPNTILYALQANISYGPMPCRIEDMGKDVSQHILVFRY